MGAVSRWAVNRPWQAIIVWVVALIAIFVGAGVHPGTYNDSFNLPDTESTKAQELMSQHFGTMTSTAKANVVFSPQEGTIEAPAVKTEITKLATEIASLGSVAAVQSPYTTPNAAQSGLISPQQNVGRLIVQFKGAEADVPKADITALVNDVEAANTPQLQVGVGGQIIDMADTEAPKSEGIGILVAIVIMLIMFGSILAAGLPILTALIGLGAGLSLVTLAANVTSIATFGPTLAAMIGLGVGIDYALFVVNRHRQAVLEGKEPRKAALEAVNTAGRAVVFAGTTVIIALCGLFVLGLNFMNGLAIGAGITVLSVMFTAVILLPAVISLLGRRTYWGKMPWARNPKPAGDHGFFFRLATLLQKKPWLSALIAVVVMLVLAIPALSMRQGFPDAGGRPPTDTTRIAYDLTTKGFGAGANGPFLIITEFNGEQDLAKINSLVQQLNAQPGVQYASPVVPGTPAVSADGHYGLIQLQPTTGPQDQATGELLDTLRSDVIPAATAGTDISAYVGGSTAITEDFSQTLADALPVFLLVVVGLGFLVLVILFRSLLVPLTAAATALLSFAAALGITVFVFQQGHLTNLFGIAGTGPILPFLPIMLFSILFGLSMDYQVFLVSRMQEEWVHTRDNKFSVRLGLGGSGRVVAAAGAIMFSVFISFVFGDNSTIKMFGLSLATAIALDAFVVRLILVPSLMTMFGKANWYLPKGLSKVLPEVVIEREVGTVADTDPEADDAQPEGETARS